MQQEEWAVGRTPDKWSPQPELLTAMRQPDTGAALRGVQRAAPDRSRPFLRPHRGFRERARLLQSATRRTSSIRAEATPRKMSLKSIPALGGSASFTRRPSASHRAAASRAARSPTPLASWSAQMITCVASRDRTSERMPPAETAANPGIAHATATLSVVSMPSPTASHSPAREMPSRTALNRAEGCFLLLLWDVCFATTVRPQVGRMNRHRPALNMLDDCYHGGQRRTKVTCLVSRSWASWMKEQRRRPCVQRDTASPQIALDDGFDCWPRVVPNGERSRGPRYVLRR